MGEVYEGTDEQSPGSRIAIKILHAEYAHDAELNARLRREADCAEKIRSPHVARVLVAGENREGRGWIAFEFLHGENLGEFLRRDRTLRFGEVAWMMEHTLRGLADAHAVDVVHRDIKPANLFIETRGPRLRICDFGVAKRLRTDGVTSGLTQLGDIVGTPSYASPEQLENAKGIDARTDIYSTALVGYRALTGRLPFEHQEFGAMREMKRLGVIASLTHASGVTWPDALESWFRRAAATNRDERFESATAALEEWLRVCEVMRDHVLSAAPSGPPREDTDLAPSSG